MGTVVCLNEHCSSSYPAILGFVDINYPVEAGAEFPYARAALIVYVRVRHNDLCYSAGEDSEAAEVYSLPGTVAGCVKFGPFLHVCAAGPVAEQLETYVGCILGIMFNPRRAVCLYVHHCHFVFACLSLVNVEPAVEG